MTNMYAELGAECKMKFEHTEVFNIAGAIRGMRNPLDSWHMSDSEQKGGCFGVGDTDMKLALKLIRAGAEHRKFLRQISVCVDITAPLYWFSEFDTYKIATVANSCSTMHKLHAYPINTDMFALDTSDWSFEDEAYWKMNAQYLERKRQRYLELKADGNPGAYAEFRKMKQALNTSFLQKRTVTLNYETIRAMCSKGQRRHHRLREWSEDFMSWARTLPYATEFLFTDEMEERA